MGANITVVGGGSYHWAPRLLADFANTPSLTDARVVLHDLDAGRMALMQDLGEQIAQLLDGMLGAKPQYLPVNLPNEGNVTNLDTGAVVEIMGVADGAGVRGRDRTTVPGIMGEFLRRINVVQEWTVEAAVAGDRELVLEAMLADPIAAQLPYEKIIEMTDEMTDELTDEMLTATARWLPSVDT